MNTRPPREAAATASPAVTSVSLSASLPSTGSAATFTLTSASPLSVSLNAKSDAWNVYAVSSLVVTVLSADAGAAFVPTVVPDG